MPPVTAVRLITPGREVTTLPGPGEDAAAATALAATRAVVAACWSFRDAGASTDQPDTADMLDISAAQAQLRDMMA